MPGLLGRIHGSLMIHITCKSAKKVNGDMREGATEVARRRTVTKPLCLALHEFLAAPASTEPNFETPNLLSLSSWHENTGSGFDKA